MSIPELSILVPVFNAENNIDYLMDKIIAQRQDSWEIICIDDGSTDNSPTILDAYQNIKHVIVVHQANSGVAQTRNHLLDLARGKYICFIDADDDISADYFHTLLQTAQSNMAQMVQCRWCIIKDNTRVYGSLNVPNDKKQQIDNLAYTSRMLSGDFGTGVLWGKLFLRSATMNLRFKQYRTGEDSDFIIRLLQRIDDIAITSDATYYYRHPLNNQSLMATLTVQDIVQQLDIRKELYRYAQSHMLSPTLITANIVASAASSCVDTARINSTEARRLFHTLRDSTIKQHFKLILKHSSLTTKLQSCLILLGYPCVRLTLKIRQLLVGLMSRFT